MVFFKNHRDYFALNIYEQKIKTVRLEKSGTRVADFTTINLPGDVIENGYVLNKEKLAEKLKEFLRSSKISQKFVAVGLCESAAFAQALTFPKLPPEEITQAIKWRSESFLPIRYDEAYLDWKKTSETKDKVSVLIVSLPKKLIDGYVQACHLAGIKPVAFETRALSLSRLIDPHLTIPVLIAEIDSSEATLAIVGASQTLQTTSALKMPSFDEDLLSETINNLLLFYEEKKFPGKKIEEIILCGSQANVALVEALKKGTKRKVSLLDSSFSGLSSKEVLEYATTISLARKDVTAPIDENTINLLPPQIQGVYDLSLRKKRISFWTNAYSLVLVLALLSFSFTSLNLFIRLREFNKALSLREAPPSPEQRRIWEQAKHINSQALTINTLLSEKSEFQENLSLLPSLLPEGVTLTNYYWEEEKEIILNGTALKRVDLLRFRENIEQTGQFKEIRIPLASLEKNENFSFTLILKLKDEQ